MAKRRKVSNLLALAVLSAARSSGRCTPTRSATTLRDWGKDQDMEIKWGSLYTVVRNLDKHGLIEAVESVRQGARPERTVYRITDAGRAELVDWVRELVSTPQHEQPRFRAGLSVLAVLHPDEATGLLRQRLELLETASPPDATRSRSTRGTSRGCSWSRRSTTWPSRRRKRPGSARCSPS